MSAIKYIFSNFLTINIHPIITKFGFCNPDFLVVFSPTDGVVFLHPRQTFVRSAQDNPLEQTLDLRNGNTSETASKLQKDHLSFVDLVFKLRIVRRKCGHQMEVAKLKMYRNSP